MSDIDVVIITDDADDTRLADDLATQLERWTGNRGHVIVLTPLDARNLWKDGRPIVDSWDQDLQMLLGDRSQVVG